MEQLMEIVTSFFASPLVKTMLGLIAADVIVGVASAIKQGVFQWRKLADFYRTNVVPYVLTYLGLYIAAELVVPELMGGHADVVSQAVVTLAWGSIVYNLATSILVNLENLGLGIGRKKF